ncbi:putative F-box/LRR-repeat protein At4g00320 [Quercus robur]|uniref:putative F-box/LRR-repeat protein At4g00320 n=1 Tax=Quercus robur TaxID=38942 RepID=UPI0021632D34|nr:putative F-box/LRR-repeat protein At4g00320 [Quercus robur]
MEVVVDKISELPEPLLHYILSFLPIKQVVQSSTLSKRWNHVCSTIPVLEFDKSFFESKLWCQDTKETCEIQRKKVELYHFVEQNLLSRRRQGLSIKKFTLAVCLSTPKSVSRVNRWIEYVVKSDVEELNLDFQTFKWKWKSYYPLPQNILLAKSITVLRLKACRLDSYFGDINLSSLKILSLYNVGTNDQIIQNLVAGCPVIEDIGIENCCGLKCIQFSGLPKVKSIELKSNKGVETVELEASNIYHVHIQQFEASKINLVPCKNLKLLMLGKLHITDSCFNYHISQLPLIEYLSVYWCDKLESIKISSHRLKTLHILKCDKLVEVEINTPKLCKLSYLGGNTISFSVTALAYLSKATYQMLHSDAPWNVKKMELLANLSNSKLLELLNINSTKDMVIPKELRDIVSSPSYRVKQLKVEISKSFTTHEFIELVDSLLWISPRLELLLITYGEWIDKNWYRETISFKFSYEKPILTGENYSCCKFLPDPCWRQCLKSVTIENCREPANVETVKADKEILEKYFYENAKILESFQFNPKVE